MGDVSDVSDCNTVALLARRCGARVNHHGRARSPRTTCTSKTRLTARVTATAHRLTSRATSRPAVPATGPRTTTTTRTTLDQVRFRSGINDGLAASETKMVADCSLQPRSHDTQLYLSTETPKVSPDVPKETNSNRLDEPDQRHVITVLRLLFYLLHVARHSSQCFLSRCRRM